MVDSNPVTGERKTDRRRPFEASSRDWRDATTNQETSKIAGKQQKLGDRHEMNSPSGA